ncbi:MAG: GNAT family N-acetyltransferase [Desulfovibrionales bacterium]|nr:GNAT family N-acetyltransferase [Desulfovibrionales bacterium]
MFIRVATPAELIRVFMVRAIVFMEEQGISCRDEMDEHDDASIHVLGEVCGEPVACGRIRFLGDRALLQRLAVRRAWRGQGHGSALLRFMLDECRRNGFHRFTLRAQTQACHFYMRHGFSVCGQEFDEAGIPHLPMLLDETTGAGGPMQTE